MRGGIWNGRGVGASDKWKHIREFVADSSLDFIGIQETQLEEVRDSWLDQMGSRQEFGWYVLPSEGRSRGILVGIRLEKIEIVEWEHGKHFVRCLLSNKHDAFKWDLVIIYGAAQSAGKEDFLREFSQVCQQRKFSTVYVGDFNLIRHAGEKICQVG
jgi:hypothetical protein